MDGRDFKNLRAVRETQMFSSLSEHAAPVVRRESRCLQYLYIYLAPSQIAGFGLFTARAFEEANEVLRVEHPNYFAPARSHAHLTALGYTHAEIFQVARDAFIPPIDAPDDFTNHSCQPNCGLRVRSDGFSMIALRDIAPNEELTYDYSTHQEHPLEDMVCHCNAINCRGIIRSFSKLPRSLQRYYLKRDVVADFAAHAVKE